MSKKTNSTAKATTEKATTENAIPEIKPFRQIPIWNQDAKFELNGLEFQTFQNFFNIFAEPISVMQNIFKRSLDSGVITLKYETEAGEELSKDEVDNYFNLMKDYLQKQAMENAPNSEVPTETPAA